MKNGDKQQRKGRRLTTLLAMLLGGYALICGLIFCLQERLVYFPGPPPQFTPSAVDLEFEDVELTTADDVRLHAWWVPVSEARGAVVLSHGNAGSVEQRLDRVATFAAMGFSTLLYDYRGYGRSEGRPSERGTYFDAEAAYDHVAQVRGVSAEQIVLFGESLGGGVTVELATRRPAACVVLEAAFTSLPDVGARVYPWLPVRWISRIRYANLEKIGGLTMPVMVVHAADDDLVPFEHGQALHAASKEPCEFLETDGGHNGGGFRRHRRWREAVRAWMVRWTEPR